jgi:hypothetical protein
MRRSVRLRPIIVLVPTRAEVRHNSSQPWPRTTLLDKNHLQPRIVKFIFSNRNSSKLTSFPRCRSQKLLRHLTISPDMAAQFLHSESIPLSNTAAVGSLFSLALGLIGTLNPGSAFELFNFTPPPKQEDRKLATNLFLFWGSRDLYMGVTTLAAWCLGDHKSLGWMYLAAAAVALTDVVQSQRQLGKIVWKHGVAIPIAITIGGALLGWFD